MAQNGEPAEKRANLNKMSDTQGPDAATVQELNDCANRMRVTSIQITTKAGSGHPTSSCSAAEIMAVLFFHEMKQDLKSLRNASSDRFVMSKGHACPVLYAAWKETGVLSEADVMTLRKIDSDIEGHPTPRLDFIDGATGSLGQGLSYAAGMAYTAKYLDKAAYRVYCLMGDGESAEGSVWEAMAFASYYKLDNLVAIFDVNRLGQTQETMLGHDMDTYKQRAQAFGFHAVVVDGHDVAAVCEALTKARTMNGKPTAIIAKTFKGHGIPGVADLDNWHGKAIGDKGIAEISALIKNKGPIKLCVRQPAADAPVLTHNAVALNQPPQYKLGEKVAPRVAYGTALVKIGANNPRVIALDAETKNSTFADTYRKAHPDRFIECFIAEQNMVGVAVGCATRDRTIAFCSTFAAFFTRAADQLRMAAVSMSNVNCVGSHVGVSIGEDGPSQMGLEDIGLFRALPGSTVFYPSDATSTERAVELAANTKGVCFIRTSRPAMPTLYTGDTQFAVGKAQVVRESANDVCVVVAAGVTLVEANKAADTLKAAGKQICVIDPFTIKPLDTKTIGAHVKRCGGRLVVVEDHYAQGGIGEACSNALNECACAPSHFAHLCVRSLPRSGPPDALLDMFGISSRHILDAINNMK